MELKTRRCTLACVKVSQILVVQLGGHCDGVAHWVCRVFAWVVRLPPVRQLRVALGDCGGVERLPCRCILERLLPARLANHILTDSVDRDY